MEAIKSWAFSISIAAVVSTITQMLVPKGNLEKVVKISLSVFMLSIIFSPFLLDVDFKMQSEDSFKIEIEDYTQTLELEMSEMIESQLSRQIEELIVAQLSGIDVHKAEVDVLIKAENANTAEVIAVEVKLDEEYKIKDTDIRYQIKNIVDCQTTVVYTER